MERDLFAPAHVIVRRAPGLACPRCSGPVYRVPRRLVDLLTGLVQPTRRYCCRSIVCAWEGNFGHPRADAARPGPTEPSRRRVESADAW